MYYNINVRIVNFARKAEWCQYSHQKEANLVSDRKSGLRRLMAINLRFFFYHSPTRMSSSFLKLYGLSLLLKSY
jgi:hypothetical protein